LDTAKITSGIDTIPKTIRAALSAGVSPYTNDSTLTVIQSTANAIINIAKPVVKMKSPIESSVDEIVDTTSTGKANTHGLTVQANPT
jgi:predicted RecA/RadA family phage recombinase